MSGLLGRATAKSTVTPASAFSVQTSVAGLPIPLVWGKARISGNLIHYADFAAIPHNSSGGGKGGLIGGGGSGGKGGGSVCYTYQVAVALGLCHGPIKSVDTLYIDKAVQQPSQQNFITLVGDGAQQPWGYLSALHPDQALAYRGLAYVAAGPMQLGSSTELPSLGFEVHAGISSAVSGVDDADPSAVIVDFLTNPNYGVGLAAARVGDLSTYTAYCRATGMLVSPTLADLTSAQDFVRTLLEATNSEAVWSQGQLRIVPRGDMAITAGTIVQTTEQHIVTPDVPISVQAPGAILSDGGVVDPASGKAYVKVASNPGAGQYVLLALGRYSFSGANVGGSVSITFTWSESASYAPPAAPFYAFGDDDYVVAGSNTDQPVQISRSAPQDAKNSVVVNFVDRTNAYASTPTPAAKDDAAIAAYGLRQDAIRDYPFFKYAQAAQQSAHLALGRNSVRNSYVWTVGQRFKLLDPMDLVSLTDAATGLNAQWVRILEITENADLTLTMTGEDYLSGTAAAPIYGSEPAAGHVSNYEQDPGFINAPLIFEPPSTLTGGATELWIAVSGASSVWGGCDTFVSYDDTNYTLVPEAHLVGPCRQGFTTAALGTDAAATLSVDISQTPGTQLTTVTATEARNLATLCWLDGELLAFTTATLTALGRYTLGGLVRGCYGTPVKVHAAGLLFARLDASIIKVPYNKALIGGAIFLKFVSFNLWGRGGQTLAAVTEIEYAFGGGQPPGVITGILATGAQAGTAMTLKASWNADALAATYQAGLSDDNGATWRPVYDGSETSTRVDGLKATVQLLFRVRGITSSGIPGVWAQVVVPPSGLTSQGSGYVDYIGYKDITQAVTDPALGRDLQTDLGELAQFAASVVQNASATLALSTANAATAAVLQISAGQLPSITAAVATQASGLVSQVATINSSLMAQIAQETKDVVALGGRIDTLQKTFGDNSAFVTGISVAQATVNSSNALRLDEVASQEGSDNDAGELADFVNAVQTGKTQAVKDRASAASQAVIVQQQIANTTALGAQALFATTLATRVSTSFASVSDSLTAQTTATTALAGRTSKVEATLGDSVTGLSATYRQAIVTAATVGDPLLGNNALATRAAALEARAGRNEAAVSSLATVNASQDQTIASLSTTVSANFQSQGGAIAANAASIGTVQTAVATQGQTIASLSTTVQSNYSTQGTQISQNASAIGTVQTTVATQGQTIASLSTSVQSNYSTQGAQISQNGAAIVTLQQSAAQQGGSLAQVSTYLSAGSNTGNDLANSDLVGNDGWSFGSTVPAGPIYNAPGYFGPAVNTLAAQIPGTTAGGYADWNSPDMPADAGVVYEASVAGAFQGPTTLVLYVGFKDRTGAVFAYGGGWTMAVTGDPVNGDQAHYTRFGGFVTAPAGTASRQLLMRTLAPASNAAVVGFFARPLSKAAAPGQTILSVYTPGTQANVPAIKASVSSLSQAVQTQNSAFATQISGLQAQVGDPNTGLSATYTSAAATRAVVSDPSVGNQALVSYAQSLAARTSSNESSISTLSGTVSNQGSTLASVQSNLWSVSDGLTATNQNVASNSSSISTLSNSYGTLSSRVDQASASSAAGTANGQVGFSAQSAPSGVTARFGVTLNASGQQPASGGFALDLDGGKVMFTVLANAFRVEDPSLRAVPFGIQNGTLYLQGVTNILSTIQSSTMIRSASTGAVAPVMSIDFQAGSIVIRDAS